MNNNHTSPANAPDRDELDEADELETGALDPDELDHPLDWLDVGADDEETDDDD